MKKSKLFSKDIPDYPHTATQTKFLLGGIGTGTVSLTASGQLTDFEIQNKPQKGNKPSYSFFCMRIAQGDKVVMRVLEAAPQPPFEAPDGFLPQHGPAGPRMQASSMRVKYPFAEIKFKDQRLPVKVKLQAFTPFIPLDAENSSIPGFVMRYVVKNTCDEDLDISLVGSMPNMMEGAPAQDSNDNRSNTFMQENGLSGILFDAKADPSSAKYGQCFLSCKTENPIAQADWYSGGWWDNIQYFWNDLMFDGNLDANPSHPATAEVMHFNGWRLKVGSVGARVTLSPGQSHTFEFYFTWYFPNRQKCWNGECDCTIRNHYATEYNGAFEAAKYLHKQLPTLEEKSALFSNALYGSTLPGYVIESLANNISILRSTTCFRIEDGTFMAYEGCTPGSGCCHGTCTHVWNYAQTVAFLFPELEKSARRLEFLQETDDKGSMQFRNNTKFGDIFTHDPAVDGQMGTILRAYREWKLTGDDAFIKELWPNIQKAMDFAFDYWDQDGDLLLEGKRHNTYDIWFHGIDCMSNSIFLAALKACSAIAEYLGDTKANEKYAAAFTRGSKAMDKALWDEHLGYYPQSIQNVDEFKYQYGKGCISDMLFGQQLSHLLSLGYVLPKEHVVSSVAKIFEHNFLQDFSQHTCLQRSYVHESEQGLLLCTWPHGGRPMFPFVYSDEVWPGIEYQVATHLIYEGFVDEGLVITKAIRDRHDGFNRNPFNEVECGNHYARSMASWGLLIALSGFSFDLCKGKIGFQPAIFQDDFSCFFSCGKGWGVYKQKLNKKTGELSRKIKILHGKKQDFVPR